MEEYWSDGKLENLIREQQVIKRRIDSVLRQYSFLREDLKRYAPKEQDLNEYNSKKLVA